jgi:hypothetical protein
MPIYLFKNFLFLQRLKASILRGSDTIHPHRYGLCPTGEKLSYDSTDLLLIPPGESVNYPKSVLYLTSCDLIERGEFDIRIIYSYELPQCFSIMSRIPSTKGELIPYLMAVRGSFISQNIWHVGNKIEGEK